MTISELERLADLYGRLDIDLGMIDGNAFTIDAVIDMQARRQGWPEAVIAVVRAEILDCTAGRDHMVEAARAVARPHRSAAPPAPNVA